MKNLVNHKSKKTNFNSANNQKKIEKVTAPLPTEHEKRKLTKAPTLPKTLEINSEKSEILVTPLKDNQSEIISHKKDESSVIVNPSPAPKLSSLTTTNLGEVANTSQIKVISRFRPLNAVEKELSTKNSGSICVKFLSPETVSVMNTFNSSNPFTLDRIFDMDTSQERLYEIVAKPTIIDVLNGYNGTIFAYGQSGSGKTFSMYGNDLYDDEVKGIIPRAIEDIFHFINDDAHKEIKFELKFSLLEIYKENLHDLLNPEIKHTELKIKEHPKKGIYVANLTEQYISSEEEFLILIENAEDYRIVSETGLNKNSSRSHLVFQLEIIQKMPDDTEKRGMLYLVDLAGSEKVSKTHAIGETLEEAKKINLSLSTLGNVISALTSHNSDHVPYRDSKLTRILQDSLGGNYKTTLLVTCSPHIYNSEETISTLKFASRAKKIKNKVKMNIKRSVEQLEAIIENLTRQLKIANEEIFKLKMGKELGNDNDIIPHSIGEGTSQIGEYLSVSDKSTLPNILGFINHSKNKSEEDIQNLIVDLKESVKTKDELIQHLNDKIENLQNENKNLMDKIKISRKEIELHSLFTNLELLSKKSIDEIKSLLSSRETNRMKQLELENVKLRESFRILETKYFNSLNEIEERIKLDNDYNIFDRSSMISIVNVDFEEEVNKIKLHMHNFFEENKDLMNDTVDSYKTIYKHSKLYVSNLLKEFMKKKDMFGAKYDVDSKENLIFNDTNRQSPPQKNLRMNYMDMKNSYVKLSMLLTFYEKIIFDLLNRMLVDLKKFEAESQNKITLEETCENFNKIINLYVEVLENIKELKQKKENEEKKVNNLNHYPHHYNLNSSIKEQIEEIEKEERDEVNELAANEKLILNLSANGGVIRHQNFNQLNEKEEADLEENKQTKFDVNSLEYIKKMSSIKSPEPNSQLRYRDSQLSNNMMDLLPNSPYQMRPYVNSNIKRPVTKKSTNYALRYHNLRKLTSKYDNLNDIITNNISNANGNGNIIDDRNQGEEINNFGINNYNNHNTQTNMFSIDEPNENLDLVYRRISRPNIKKTGFWNKYKENKESFVSTGSKRGRCEGIDLIAENKYLNKELVMYKNMVMSLSKQWSCRKAIDSEMNNIINDYKEDQKALLIDEFDKVRHIMKVYKYFYEDELLAKRNMIEELAKIIDELYLNNSNVEMNIYDTTKQNGRCISIPSANIFSNIFNSTSLVQSFSNSPVANYNTSTHLNHPMQKNKSLINDYLEYKKEKILNQHNYTESSEANNISVRKIAEAYIHEGGTATKKMDYILFSIDKDHDECKITFGSGLNGHTPSKSPLYRNIKMSLIGDTHSDIESPEASD